LLKAAGGHLKTALVMAQKKISRPEAQRLLRQTDGKLFRILE